MFQLRKTGLKSQARAGILGKNRRRLSDQSVMAKTVKIKPKSTTTSKAETA